MIPQIVDERLGFYEAKNHILSLSPTDSYSIPVAILLSGVDPELKRPQAICIVPKPESAVQLMDLLLKMRNRITCVLGLPPSIQDFALHAMKLPVKEQVIIGTPITIHKWILCRKLVLEGPGLILVDDIDQLLAQPGFKDEVVRILKALGISKRSPQCQVIMCSSVWGDAVEEFVSNTRRSLCKKEYTSLNAKAEGPSLDNIERCQECFIMRSLHDKNVISQIGSGKATSLVRAMLCRVDRELKHAQTICIVPNKELALQIKDMLMEMGKHNPVTCVLGLPPSKQDYELHSKKLPVEAQVIVGTPLTIHKWILSRKLVLEGVRLLLVDDVYHLLAQPGFRDETFRIMKAIGMSKRSPQCQVIVYSSISNGAVEAFVLNTKRILSKNEYITVPSLDKVKHYTVMVPDEHLKFDIIKNKILDLNDEAAQAVIFIDTKESSLLCAALEANKFKFKMIDAAFTPVKRERAFKEFKKRRYQVLISTEILDWVFDQSQVGLVIICNVSSILGSASDQQYSRCVGREGDYQGAVFSLTCGDTDRMIMEKIKMQNNVTEVLWTCEQQFEDALRKAGL